VRRCREGRAHGMREGLVAAVYDNKELDAETLVRTAAGIAA